MLIALAIALLAGIVLAPMARAGTDDYPGAVAQRRPGLGDQLVGLLQPWSCTSFVAWRLHARNGFEMPRAIGNAGSWGSWFSAHGYAVNGTPGVGAIAEASRGRLPWVEAVNGNGTITIEEYNYNYNGTYNERRVAASTFHYIHARDIVASPQPPSPPGPQTSVRAGPRIAGEPPLGRGRGGGRLPGVPRRRLPHDRERHHLPRHPDLPGTRSRTYTITAHNSAGTSSPVSKQVETAYEAADRADLPTKDGPALCGRAGDRTSQWLVCNVHTPTGWITSTSAPDDWGYSSDRSWLRNLDGTVSYCRRVGNGAQVLCCNRFDGAGWTSSMSHHTKLGDGNPLPGSRRRTVLPSAAARATRTRNRSSATSRHQLVQPASPRPVATGDTRRTDRG